MSYQSELTKDLPLSAAALVELSALQGEEFLSRCAAWLCEELDVFAVSIGELGGACVDEIEVLSFQRRDQLPGPDRYSLKGSPCEKVIESLESYSVTADASARYPGEKLFAQCGIESYVGAPLRDGFGRAFGLVCVFDDKARNDTEEITTLIRWLSGRIGSEAGAIRTRRNLQNSIRWMAPSSPHEVYANTTAHLCEVLQTTTSLIAEWPEDRPGEIRILTLLHEGVRQKPQPDQYHRLSDTAFAGLRESKTLTISDQLTQLHPDCPVLGSLQLRGCLAVAIRDQEGRSIGHLAIAHSGALEQELHHSPVLALYVARVTAELERRVIERENAAMERALGVKHKLESLGLMAGHIAHDFNNLLMAILGNANLASEQLDPGNPGHTYIENIEAAATSAGDVVSQLLDYAGRKPNRVSLLDVSDAVREASRLVELTRDPSISVEYQLAESLPLVEADPAQLQQIVINLVLNAAEALGRRRGVIGIGVAEVSLQVKDIQRLIQGRDLAPGSYVEIQVTDTGVGIDEMTLQRMFDPFFSSKPDGRGLGLSAVRGFVQACGGGLSVTSKLGSGTSISLFLRPAVGKRVAVVPAIIHHRGDRLPILVVDDELLVAQTAAGMLEALGFEVQMALSCEEALALARKKNYGCAVIDIRMPRIDGWTTLRRLRELCPELPAVMMTGYSNQARATELVAKFRVGMLYKPFEAGDLVTAISEVANPAAAAS